jgi:hypothetical protein
LTECDDIAGQSGFFVQIESADGITVSQILGEQDGGAGDAQRSRIFERRLDLFIALTIRWFFIPDESRADGFESAAWLSLLGELAGNLDERHHR